MIVRTAAYKAQTSFDKSVRHCLGVFEDLLLISLKFGRKSLFESNRFCRYYMHKRTALRTGENRLVDLLCDIFVVAKDKTSSGPSQRLVRGGSDNVRISDGAWVQSRRNHTGNVRYIRHEIRTNLVGNLAEFLVVDKSRIRTCAGNDEFGLTFKRNPTHFVVVDKLGLRVYAVAVEELAAHIHFCAVREVSAVGKRHAENGISATEQGVIRRKVCI